MEYELMERVEDFGIPETIDAMSLGVFTRSALKIARAITGETEVRLISVTRDGIHLHFALENAVLLPYSTQRSELSSPSKDDALVAFQLAVEKKYPKAVLRSGKQVAIHHALM
jgi:hypothetical protein